MAVHISGQFVATNSALEEVYDILRSSYADVIEEERGNDSGSGDKHDRNNYEDFVADDDHDDDSDVWRILAVIRSGRCSPIANWTDSIAAGRAIHGGMLRTLPRRVARRSDADTTIGGGGGGRCFTSSPAELRWLMRRLRTAGYRCGIEPPPTRRHRQPVGAPAAAVSSPRPADGRSLRLLVGTLTNGPTRDGRAVSEDDVTTRDDDQQDAAAAARVFGDSDIASNARHRHRQNQYAEKLHRISHILHYCSIVILGIFAFQVLNSDDVSPLTPTVTVWVQL